jgi:hypothetical protein
MAWRRVVESVELEGGLCPWWYVHLLPKMVNKINTIEYSGGTGSLIGKSSRYHGPGCGSQDILFCNFV